MVYLKHILLTIFFIGSLQLNAEKYALIIAIGDYPAEGGWPSISSVNDVDHILAAIKHIGFKENNIQILLNENATKKGIISSLKTLESKLKKGDVVFIHFSGHGQQVLDNNGDELDQLDEAIVPFDSPLLYQEGIYEGDLLIRDDELGTLTKRIRKKCSESGQLLLVLDSCHSGTGVRGFIKARGTDKIMAPSTFSHSAKAGEKTMGLNQDDEKSLAPMASFFGASAKELNYETLDQDSRPVGSLSYAFSSVLLNMNQKYSYQELFERIQLKMKSIAPRQKPQWEGPSDTFVLGGQASQVDYLFSITKISGTNIKADVGTINGLYEGSTVQVVSLSDYSIKCKGVVTKSSITHCEIELDESISKFKDELLKVEILTKSPPSRKVVLNSLISSSSPWKNIANNVLSHYSIKSSDINPELILKEINGELVLENSREQLLYKNSYVNSFEAKYIDDLSNILDAYNQGAFIRDFDQNSAKIDFSLECLIVDCDSGKTTKYVPGINSNLTLGTCVKFKITNNGSVGAYYSLVDVQPDNRVNLIIPFENYRYTAEEYYLEGGQSYTTDFIIEIAEPLGEELIKLICSKSPMDLSIIADKTDTNMRGFGEINFFEASIKSTLKEQAFRGAKVKRVKKDEISTESIFFSIIK